MKRATAFPIIHPCFVKQAKIGHPHNPAFKIANKNSLAFKTKQEQNFFPVLLATIVESANLSWSNDTRHRLSPKAFNQKPKQEKSAKLRKAGFNQ